MKLGKLSDPSDQQTKLWANLVLGMQNSRRAECTGTVVEPAAGSRVKVRINASCLSVSQEKS